MSKGGDVLVRVTHADGTPASNMYLIVRDGMRDQHYAHPVCQGSLEYSEVMLTNVPCYPGDYRVGVYASDLKNDSLAESQLFTPTSGRVTVVPVTLEPLARFIVRFTDPVRMNTLLLSARSRNREFTFHNFFSDNFVVRNNELSKDSVQPGTYDVTVQGESVSYVRTNLAFEAGRTTFLEILSGSNHVGAISGTVREAGGIPLDCTVSALPETIGAGADSVSDRDGVGANTWARNGEFRVDGLDLERIYTVRVTLYATRHTNIYIRGVRPDGPPLDIVLQAAYKVTGRVVDADGKGVSARVYCGQSATPRTQTDESGEFRLHPAFPGVVLLNVAPAEFAPVTRAVPVANSDVDVGTIVVTDRGITVSGRIVNGRHQPLQGVNLNVSQSGGAGEAVTAPYEASVYSRGDGVFQLRGVPRGVRLKIHLAWGRRSLPGPELGLTDRDINIGDIVRSEPSDAEEAK